MPFSICTKEERHHCTIMASVLTLFYGFSLWRTQPLDAGMFALIAYTLGPALLALWYLTLSCGKG